MPLRPLSLSALAASLLLLSASPSSAKSCPPLGAVLPPPRSPSTHPAVQSAAENLTSTLDGIAASLNASGISVAVKSVHEDAPLFSWHFTPPVTSGVGTDSIDGDTIWRVGSVSKMMPALAALQRAEVDMEASVVEYLPELAENEGEGVNAVRWRDITVRSLANHLAGLATDFAMDLAVFPVDAWLEMGLPEVAEGTGPTCSGLPGTAPCTKDDLLANINRRNPVFLAQSSSPVYSNLAYALLGLVIEAATGESFSDVVQAGILDVAGMDSTSFYGPVDSFAHDGFVPRGETTWNATLGVFEAAGGMFSSTNDLLAFAAAIHTARLLPAAATRAWMKPDAHTSSAGVSVGAAWEILRGDGLTADARLVDVYTKSGDLGLYHALLGIVPDYDLVVSVLAAGAEVTLDPYARSRIFSAVLRALLPAVEAAGREDARDTFAGTYTQESSNASLVLASDDDDDGPGLLIERFSVRGFDVLRNINSYSLAALESGVNPDPATVEGRLYPSDRTSGQRNGTTTTTAWRAIFDAKTDEQRAELDRELFWLDGSCETWFGADRSAYNFLSLSDFHVVQGADGAVLSIANKAFNVTLTKVSGGNGGEESGSDTVPESGARVVQISGLAILVSTLLTVVALS